MFLYVCVGVCERERESVCICVNEFAAFYFCASVYGRVHVCVFIHIKTQDHICIFVYAHTSIYIYAHTHPQTHTYNAKENTNIVVSCASVHIFIYLHEYMSI